MPETPKDPFKQARREAGVLPAQLDGDTIPMILRYKDVRQAAGDWHTYSSDAPFRVPIPSEEDVRNVRQLPIETDPPEHTEYRALVEPFFRRPKEPGYAERIERLIDALLDDAMGRERIEIVRGFALPLQSRALTHLLNVPESEAEEWIGWGTHVFRDGDGTQKGSVLDAYIHRHLERAAEQPGEDFFSALTRATYQGRPLTREEMAGFANLTFAGGRDTVINSVAGSIGYLGGNPKALPWLREDPKRVLSATEEFMRALSPLTHIGRVCPVKTDVHGHTVEAGERVSLCWASANYDETVFDAPEEVRLDRRPNPHIAFGAGAHNCLGAAHARLIMRTLLTRLAERVGAIVVLEAEENRESRPDYERVVAYESLTVRLEAR